MKRTALLHEIRRQVWAIVPEALHRVLAAIEAGAPLEQLRAASAGNAVRPMSDAGRRIAILPLTGFISYRPTLWSTLFGGTNLVSFGAELRKLVDDPSVKTIILDVDSPGGGVAGVEETAQEILEARKKKRIVAMSNSLAASAAYWIASAASELVMIPSGEVGSIGVFALHEDISEALRAAGVKISLISAGKFKTEGNPFEPLGEEAHAAIQEDVDHFHAMFVSSVARGRGVAPAVVRRTFGEGRLVTADRARRLGMVDRVESAGQTVSRLLAGLSDRAASSAFGADEDLRLRHDWLRRAAPVPSRPSQSPRRSDADEDLELRFRHTVRRAPAAG